jgi:hypothetical protein
MKSATLRTRAASPKQPSVDANPPVPLPQFPNGVHRFIDLRLLPGEFRHDSGHSTLYLIEEPGKMSFHLGGLDLAHQIDQSN